MVMRKIILAFVLCVLTATYAWADRTPELADFPTLGRCTGNGVRLRADADTKSTILGKLDDGDVVVVLDETLAHGDTWYEVDHPTKKGKAWVFGKYLEGIYEESYQASPKHKLIMSLYLTFGMTSEKAVALSGKPNKRTRERIGADKLVRVTMDWGNYSVEYLGETLTGVEVKKGNKRFGNIRIGDSTEKLLDEIGEPNSKEDSSWLYQEGEMTYITFAIKNNKVSSMNYQVYYDIEPE